VIVRISSYILLFVSNIWRTSPRFYTLTRST